MDGYGHHHGIVSGLGLVENMNCQSKQVATEVAAGNQSSVWHQHLHNIVYPSAVQTHGLEEFIQTLPDVSTNQYNTNAQLSHASRDYHSDSTQQAVPSCSLAQFNSLQKKEDDKTPTNTETSSCQKTQVRGMPAVGESTYKGKIIKPRAWRRPPIRRVALVNSDIAPQRIKTSPLSPAYIIRKSKISNVVQMLPLRDRVVHLLALRGYNKSELLVRLQKDGIPNDARSLLGDILQQVAILKSDLSYSLKDHLFKELQSDWPGYTDLDKQVLHLVLSKKKIPSLSTLGTDPPDTSIVFTTTETPSLPEEELHGSTIDPLRKKKIRISHLATADQKTSKHPPSNTSESCGTARPTLPPLPEEPLPTAKKSQVMNSNFNPCLTTKTPAVQEAFDGSVRPKSRMVKEQQGKEARRDKVPSTVVPKEQPVRCEKRHRMLDQENQQKEVQEKNQNHKPASMKKRKRDTERKGQDTKANFSEEVALGQTCPTSNLPDYLLEYITIVNPEQRHRYRKVYKADYKEYQVLQEKIQSVATVYIDIQSKRNQYSKGSKEYEKIDKALKEEYQHLKEVNPTFYGEKKRCWYLYKKLTHIKKLLSRYDLQQKLKPKSG